MMPSQSMTLTSTLGLEHECCIHELYDRAAALYDDAVDLSLVPLVDKDPWSEARMFPDAVGLASGDGAGELR